MLELALTYGSDQHLGRWKNRNYKNLGVQLTEHSNHERLPSWFPNIPPEQGPLALHVLRTVGFFLLFETRSHYLTLAGFELKTSIHLCLPLQYCDLRCKPPRPAPGPCY